MTKHANQYLKLYVLGVVFMYVATAFAVQDVAGAVEGSVKKVDAASKTLVVDTVDGAEHSFHLADNFVVHTGKAATSATTDSLRGIRAGSHVAVHYTAQASRESAQEIDDLGDSGLKAVKGTGVHFDSAGKKVAITTAEGTSKIFDLSDSTARDMAKETAKGADETSKITLYYSEVAGRKTVHFISRAI
jgi:hypothetical protein